MDTLFITHLVKLNDPIELKLLTIEQNSKEKYTTIHKESTKGKTTPLIIKPNKAHRMIREHNKSCEHIVNPLVIHGSIYKVLKKYKGNRKISLVHNKKKQGGIIKEFEQS